VMLSIASASAEVILIDMAMLLLTVATILIFFYGSKKIFPADFRQPQFFLTFIIVMVPLIIQFYFGLAVLNYHSVAKVFGWPTPLPLESSSPLFLYRPSGVALVAMAQGGVVARRIAANIANLPELLRK
jgi:uncharacterized membrane protein YcgQ (UPF0703/DUF1980 family)